MLENFDAEPDPQADADAQQQALIEKLQRQQIELQAAQKNSVKPLSSTDHYAEKQAEDAKRAERFQPQLPYGLWPSVPLTLFALGVLGFVIPYLRNAVRDMLDGHERNHPEQRFPEPMATVVRYLRLNGWFIRYRGPWWRGAVLGGAWILLWYAVLNRADTLIAVFWCSAGVPFVLWSIYRGARFGFRLFGEYDHYERIDFPELYSAGSQSQYQIPTDAPERLNQQVIVFGVIAAISGLLAWWTAGGSFISNVFFVIFVAVAVVAALLFIGAMLIRLYLMARINGD